MESLRQYIENIFLQRRFIFTYAGQQRVPLTRNLLSPTQDFWLNMNLSSALWLKSQSLDCTSSLYPHTQLLLPVYGLFLSAPWRFISFYESSIIWHKFCVVEYIIFLSRRAPQRISLAIIPEVEASPHYLVHPLTYPVFSSQYLFTI